jgi:RecA-family ATPase
MADTIKPRLEQAGADCEKVAYIIDDDIALTLEDGRIETVIQETGASLFVIDPIQAFIPPDSDMQSATKMRAVLRKLAATAEKYRCAVILIGHMNKGSGAKSLYRGLGSIDIAAIARSVLMISRDETRPNIRYMYPIKSSLAPEGPAVAFSFRTNGGLEWQGQYELNTAELVDSLTVKTSKREKARAKMVQMLGSGDKAAKEVYAALADIGVGSRTVEKAKKELQIRTYRTGGCWYWGLPNKSEG